jgi:hypothetical protein
MKNNNETSDSSTKQGYSQPTLVELGELKTETLAGNQVANNDGTSA